MKVYGIMTSEISIMNKRGVALAADSAVTVGGSKIFNSVNKIFTLSSSHYIGIMIYGNASLGRIPWEVLIKNFRENLGNEVSNDFDTYVELFLEYINDAPYVKDSRQDYHLIRNYLDQVTERIEFIINQNYGYIDNAQEFNGKLAVTINELHAESGKTLGLDKQQFDDAYAPEIQERLVSTFEYLKYPISEDVKLKFSDMIFKLIDDINFIGSSFSGVVLAGYGANEPFPKMAELKIDGFIFNKLKYLIDSSVTISDDPDDGSMSYSLNTFAQSDVTMSFINGIDTEYLEFIQNRNRELRDSIVNNLPEHSEEISRKFDENKKVVDNFMKENYRIPFGSMIEFLTIPEMSEMAETFINLTSFKRHYSDSVETVGGEVDALVISRSEGPIWTKRKRYFDRVDNIGYEKRRM